MAINKVTYQGQTLMDITDSTVSPDTLGKGIIAYAANGEKIVGAAEVTNTGGGEEEASPLTQLIEGTLTELYDEGATSVGSYKFYQMSNLTKVDLPNVTSIDAYGFRASWALTNINLPKLTAVGAYSLANTGLEEINFPLLTSVSSGAFSYNTNLTKVYLPLVSEGSMSGLFQGCSLLTDVYMPLANLDSEMFRECSSLVEAFFPQNTKYPSWTFLDCSSLERVDIGAPYSSYSTDGISSNAFTRCSSLKLLIIRAKSRVPLEDSSAFSGSPFESGGTGGTVYVARTTLYSYETSTNWSALYAAGTCTFKALEDYTVDGTLTGEIDWDKIESGVLETATIPAGTYVAPETLDRTALTNIAGDYPMTFVCEGTSHKYFRVTTGSYIYYDNVYAGRLLYATPEWSKPTITLETDQEVNPKFAEWFTANYILQTT